jgi:hypothetical protein
MKPADIIDDAKRIAQDNGILRTPDLYADATFLTFVNKTLKQTAILRPDLFAVLAELSTAPNVAEQSLPTDAIKLLDIFSIRNGSAIVEVSRQVMDRSYPQWRSDASGVPVNFMRHPLNPNRYFLYPRPVAGIVLSGEYARTPPEYTLQQDIEVIPDSYQPVIVFGVLTHIAGIENPTQDGQRYNQFQQTYLGMLQTESDQRAARRAQYVNQDV